jgi:hypothetical protein
MSRQLSEPTPGSRESGHAQRRRTCGQENGGRHEQPTLGTGQRPVPRDIRQQLHASTCRTIPRVTESRADGIGLWFALVFPSSFIVRKYLGWESTIAYAIVVAAILAFAPRWVTRLSDRTVFWLWLAIMGGIVAAFVLIYPVVNTHVPGVGSDDDDALEAATRALFAGHSPYGVRTYLGNAVHHLPGAFLLAAPFVWLGSSALQNLFWLTAFFVCLARQHGARTALSMAWPIVLLSPAVMHDMVTGTGYLSNAISVALLLWWLIRTRHRDLAAVAWGVALASRANFILLVPLAFAALRQAADWKTAVRATSLTCLTIACLALPFYLHDPSHFTPLEGANRLLVFDQLVPHLGVALMAAMAALAIFLSFRQNSASALFRNCALVQAFPSVAGVVLGSMLNGRVDLTYARYGAFFAWFVFVMEGIAAPDDPGIVAHGEWAIVR